MKKHHVARKKRRIQGDKPSHVEALETAIAHCGGQAQLAAAIARFMGDGCKVSQQTVSYWVNKEVLLEAKWWPAFEHVTNGKVTCTDLRPDVFRRSVVLESHVA